MRTAPSFTDYKHLSEPYTKNGKTYILVEHPRTHKQREVRFYSEEEFRKLYKEKDPDPGYELLKHARGFDNGPIMVIRNITTPEEEDWCRLSCARHAMGIEWHFVSTDSIPLDIPPSLKLIPLTWEEFRRGDDYHAKSPEELASIIAKKAVTTVVTA